MVKSKEEQFLFGEDDRKWNNDEHPGSGRNPCSEVRLCRDETAAAGCVLQRVHAAIEGRGRRAGGEG